MKNIDTRRFRIYKSDEDGKWVLLLNGLARSFMARVESSVGISVTGEVLA